MKTDIVLYIKKGCFYCERVKSVCRSNSIEYTEKNITDEGVDAELIKLGGKHQVPFMVDGDVMMYESRSIIDYISKKYTKVETSQKVQIHYVKGPNMCTS